MICANCGREMPDPVRYCGICGTLNPLLENTAPAQEYTDTVTSEPFVQEYTTDTLTEEQPAQKGIQTNVAHLQERTPYAQTGSTHAPEYRAYTPADMTRPEEKEKRTCSLSVVIFCGVVIFLLSVACGVLAGLYLSARSTAAAPYPLTEYRES